MSPQVPNGETTKIEKDEEINTTTISRTDEKSSNDSGNKSLTTAFGSAMASFSDVINENLIAARYGTFATITLLTAFGLSRTPIFFRHKRVSEIPSHFFSRRRTIYGRIVHVVDNDIMSRYCLLHQIQAIDSCAI